MKKIIPLVFIAVILIVSNAHGQTKTDSIEIEQACRNYVEGWARGDVYRVDKAVSPELAKLSVFKDKDGASYTTPMSASLLKLVTKTNKNGVKGHDYEPEKEFKLDVMIYDISGDYASAKTVNTKYGFFDYCQLAKFDGEWRIFNVLWGPLESN